MADLIITNGDGAGDLLAAAGKGGTILPWRDVLHEGPIRAGPLATCTAARVAYLAERFALDPETVAEEFAERDGIVARHEDFGEIALWFEHDLYDQLQIVQILAFFAEVGRETGLTMVQADDFLGAERPETILRFEALARPITAADLVLAQTVWADLTAPTPEPVARRLSAMDSRLPFLHSALQRFLEELPAPGTGLTRSETVALGGIAQGIHAPGELFRALIASEEAAFMGDASFFRLLDDLAFCEVPLIAGVPRPAGGDNARFREADLELTMAGDDVLAAEDDHVAMSGVDRWWAGTRLLGRDVWRYDRATMALVPPGASGA